jgi:hypothetical protein
VQQNWADVRELISRQKGLGDYHVVANALSMWHALRALIEGCLSIEVV